MNERDNDVTSRKRFCGVAGKSGAPRENRNAMRHGLRAGKLPAKCQYVEHRVNSLRRQLEDAVADVKGGVGIVDAANINSAAKWERHGLLAQHWLRHEAEKLTPTERLKFSEAIAKASDARDKAIRLLGLDIPPEPVDLKTYLTQADGDGEHTNET